MTIVHFVFIGLVSFFRDADGVHAYLVNTVGPQRASDGFLIPTHQAFVAIPYRGTDCPDEARLNKDLDPPYFCSWLIQHDDVSVVGKFVAGDSNQDLCTHSDTNDCPARMRISDQALLALKGACRSPKPLDCSLTGRVVLPVQQISGVSLCGVQVLFGHVRDPRPSEDRGPIAEVAWADLRLGTEGLDINMRRFNSLTGGRTISLPLHGISDSWVLVGFVDRSHQSQCSPSCSSKVDHHFEMFYRLSEQETYTLDRKVPHACCRCGYRPPRLPSWLDKLLADLDRVKWSDNNNEEKDRAFLGLSQRIICPMSSF